MWNINFKQKRKYINLLSVYGLSSKAHHLERHTINPERIKEKYWMEIHLKWFETLVLWSWKLAKWLNWRKGVLQAIIHIMNVCVRFSINKTQNEKERMGEKGRFCHFGPSRLPMKQPKIIIISFLRKSKGNITEHTTSNSKRQENMQ